MWSGNLWNIPCFALGYTPRDVERYTCAECGDKGHMKFRRDALKNDKRRGQRSDLVCLDCADRHKEIEGTLKDKKAIRCTCGGKQSNRVHIFSNEKCSLFQRFAGERRWPGSNMGVTADDFQFCERMRKRRRS